MPKFRLTGRKAAFAGLTAAAATAAVVAVTVPASAAPVQKTTCSDNVRVRSQPSATAPVIGSCKAGEAVTVDGTRNGFAHLANKKGWASQTYVKLPRSADSNTTSSYDGANPDSSPTDAAGNSSERDYQYDSNGDRYYVDSNGKKHYDRGSRSSTDERGSNNRDGGTGGLLGGLTP